MRINTLNRRHLEDAPRPGMGQSFEEFEAELHSAIAKLHVSDENVTASDSHIPHTEMSAEMRTYTESQIRLQPGARDAQAGRRRPAEDPRPPPVARSPGRRRS